MNVKQLINQLKMLRKDLMDKEVFVIAENGLKVPPDIKLKKKDYVNLSCSKYNVEYIVLEG